MRAGYDGLAILMTASNIYQITSIGTPLAKRLPQSGCWGTVLAVFRRSCYLESVDGHIFCLADSSLGEGPLTLGVGFPGNTTLSNIGVTGGCHLDMDGLDLRLGRSIVFQKSEMSIWAPERIWKTATPIEILLRMHTLTNLIKPLIPSDGLGPIMPYVAGQADGKFPTNDSMNAVAKLAVRSLDRLCGGLIRSDIEAVDEGVSGLVGLGPGLTPSGDDLLGGLLVALRAMPDAASHPIVEVLSACTNRHAAEKTTRISSSMLEQSTRGNGSAVQHGLLRCLLEVDARSDISSAALDLIRTGHTSGWDALAGILLGIHLSLRMNQIFKETSSAMQKTAGIPA